MKQPAADPFDRLRGSLVVAVEPAVEWLVRQIDRHPLLAALASPRLDRPVRWIWIAICLWPAVMAVLVAYLGGLWDLLPKALILAAIWVALVVWAFREDS